MHTYNHTLLLTLFLSAALPSYTSDTQPQQLASFADYTFNAVGNSALVCLTALFLEQAFDYATDGDIMPGCIALAGASLFGYATLHKLYNYLKQKSGLSKFGLYMNTGTDICLLPFAAAFIISGQNNGGHPMISAACLIIYVAKYMFLSRSQHQKNMSLSANQPVEQLCNSTPDTTINAIEPVKENV